MNNSSNNKFQITKGSATLRLREILMDSDGLVTLVKLNLLFLLTALPFLPFVALFTGGPAITALLYCTNRLVKTGSVSQVGKTYITVFKESFRKTVPAGILSFILNVIFIGGLILYLILASENMLYIPFASVSLLGVIFVWAVTIHLFPAFSENENQDKSLKELISAAAATAIVRMKKTVIAVTVSMFIIAAVVLMLPNTLPLVFVMIFSVPALAAGFAHTDREFISDII